MIGSSSVIVTTCESPSATDTVRGDGLTFAAPAALIELPNTAIRTMTPPPARAIQRGSLGDRGADIAPTYAAPW
jgi:hypothetical protein